MGRSKGTDEVFCTACGARIKRAAARCPHCGVANEWHDPSAARTANGDSTGESPPGGGGSGRTEREVPDQRTPSEVQATRDAETVRDAEASRDPVAESDAEAARDPADAHTSAATRDGRATRRSGAGGEPRADEAASPDWWYGVAAFAAAWAVVLGAWAAGLQHGALGAIALVAWVGLPASLARDAAFVRARSRWEPSGGPWTVLALVPVLNLAVAGVYLLRRHEVLGTP